MKLLLQGFWKSENDCFGPYPNHQPKKMLHIYFSGLDLTLLNCCTTIKRIEKVL